MQFDVDLSSDDKRLLTAIRHVRTICSNRGLTTELNRMAADERQAPAEKRSTGAIANEVEALAIKLEGHRR
jgi:hypothetical protein